MAGISSSYKIILLFTSWFACCELFLGEIKFAPFRKKKSIIWFWIHFISPQKSELSISVMLDSCFDSRFMMFEYSLSNLIYWILNHRCQVCWHSGAFLGGNSWCLEFLLDEIKFNLVMPLFFNRKMIIYCGVEFFRNKSDIWEKFDIREKCDIWKSNFFKLFLSVDLLKSK